MNGERIEGYSQGDETGIIKLHREVFQSDLDTDRWKWQFMEGHPDGKGWISLAKYGSEIVGQNCVMRHHLNFNGRQIPAGQSCDTMVRSDQRGKQLFKKIAYTNYELARNNDAQAVFGFPNRNSYPCLMRHLGWVRLFNLKYYYYILGCEKILGPMADIVARSLIRLKIIYEKKINFLTRNQEHEVVTVDKLPAEIDELLLEINKYEVLSIWKDVDYLKWRYEYHPHNKYLFHLLKVKGKFECIIITKNFDKGTHICDVLSRSKNQLFTLYLLYQVMFLSIHNKAQKIDFHGYDNGFFSCLFKAAGFNERPSNFVLCGKAFDDQGKLREYFNLPNNWTVSAGDIDVY